MPSVRRNSGGLVEYRLSTPYSGPVRNPQRNALRQIKALVQMAGQDGSETARRINWRLL